MFTIIILSVFHNLDLVSENFYPLIILIYVKSTFWLKIVTSYPILFI